MCGKNDYGKRLNNQGKQTAQNYDFLKLLLMLKRKQEASHSRHRPAGARSERGSAV